MVNKCEFIANLVSAQAGAAAILRTMVDMGFITSDELSGKSSWRSAKYEQFTNDGGIRFEPDPLWSWSVGTAS